MEISDHLRCLFSARITDRDDAYVVEIPKREVELGGIQPGETYRVAVLWSPSEDAADTTGQAEDGGPSETETPEPPVEEGERRTVEIEDIGEQGDGITRVERGFVVIVPDTEQGERVTIDITDVRENVAFAEVVERLDYYE